MCTMFVGVYRDIWPLHVNIFLAYGFGDILNIYRVHTSMYTAKYRTTNNCYPLDSHADIHLYKYYTKFCKAAPKPSKESLKGHILKYPCCPEQQPL